MRKTLEKTILSCGVQVRNGLSNVFSVDRYDTLVLYYLLSFSSFFVRPCTIAEFATPTVW